MLYFSCIQTITIVLAVYGTHSLMCKTTETSSNKFRVVSLAMEAIGDVTASAEVSRLPVDGIEFDSRIQGGVLVCTHLLVFSSHITSLSQTDVLPTE